MKLKKSLSAILVLILVFALSIPVSAKAGVTYSSFLKIKMGSKYSSVVKILGRKGKVETTSEVGNYKSVVYSWDTGMADINVTIQNGKVVQKVQTSLSNRTAKITKAKYNKLKKGMSYKKVKTILGKGVLISQSKMFGESMAGYSWRSKSSSYITCTFTNGKLYTMSSFWM